MEIEVTQEDIDNGTKRNCDKCPIALAINRALKISTASIGLFAGWVDYPKGRFGFPNEVAVFIKKFDAGASVTPFSFDIDSPTEMQSV